MKIRVISAIIMLMAFIPILLLGNVYYTIFGCILGLMSLWELHNLEKNIPLIMKLISYGICLFLILYQNNNFSFLIISSVLLLFIFSLIIYGNIAKYNYKDCMFLFSSTIIIGLLYNSFVDVRLMGLEQVIYCFVISITTDTFAYIGGSLLGKHKLAPTISPNKTIEGSIIGSLMGTMMGSAFYYNIIDKSNLWLVILISFILTILAQIGDLFFSSIKRSYKIKDFSNLIPGHGGVLDRLDSVLFVILGFLLYNLFI